MQKFMLIIKEDLAELARAGDTERYRKMRVMMAWVESLHESVSYLGGEPLEVPRKYVTKDQIVSDGPFIEAKEGITGYMMIDAENLEQAAAIAQSCPLVQLDQMSIEVSAVLSTNIPTENGKS